MGRPSVITVENNARIVLSVLAGEMTIGEAARRERVSEQWLGRWKAGFLEAGKAGLEIRVWKKSAQGKLDADQGPRGNPYRSRHLPTEGLVKLIDMLFLTGRLAGQGLPRENTQGAMARTEGCAGVGD